MAHVGQTADNIPAPSSVLRYWQGKTVIHLARLGRQDAVSTAPAGELSKYCRTTHGTGQ